MGWGIGFVWIGFFRLFGGWGWSILDGLYVMVEFGGESGGPA